jgi:hypothetical protein
MRSGSNLMVTALGFILLACSPPQRLVRNAGDEGVIAPTACDAVMANICVTRPSPNDFISISEIVRSFHGEVFRVDFRSPKGDVRSSVMVTQWAGVDKPAQNCSDGRQSWCRDVIISRDIFYSISDDLKRKDAGGFVGAHIDVIGSEKGVNVRDLVASFLVCHSVEKRLICDRGLRESKIPSAPSN